MVPFLTAKNVTTDYTKDFHDHSHVYSNRKSEVPPPSHHPLLGHIHSIGTGMRVGVIFGGTKLLIVCTRTTEELLVVIKLLVICFYMTNN